MANEHMRRFKFSHQGKAAQTLQEAPACAHQDKQNQEVTSAGQDGEDLEASYVAGLVQSLWETALWSLKLSNYRAALRPATLPLGIPPPPRNGHMSTRG